jgi:hypothetical protein
MQSCLTFLLSNIDNPPTGFRPAKQLLAPSGDGHRTTGVSHVGLRRYPL